MSDELQTCAHCGKQYGFTAIGPCPCGKYFFPGGQRFPRGEISTPATVECTRSPGELTIRWRWMSKDALVTIVGSLLIGIVGGYLTRKSFAPFVVALACAGLYLGVATRINSTWITGRDGWIRVRSSPLPFRRSVQLRREEIRQLFSRARIKRGPGDSRWHGSGSAYVVYDVVACVAPDEHRVSLVTGMDDANAALFVERELERELGIEDAPVPEELRRG